MREDTRRLRVLRQVRAGAKPRERLEVATCIVEKYLDYENDLLSINDQGLRELDFLENLYPEIPDHYLMSAAQPVDKCGMKKTSNASLAHDLAINLDDTDTAALIALITKAKDNSAGAAILSKSNIDGRVRRERAARLEEIVTALNNNKR